MFPCTCKPTANNTQPIIDLLKYKITLILRHLFIKLELAILTMFAVARE